MRPNPYSLTAPQAPISQDRWEALQRRIPLMVVLVASSALSVTLFALRSMHIGAPVYFFLNWNLFLAWLPLLAASVAWLLQGDAQRPRLRVVPVLVLWLLFFPNAPYIVTDLMHLKPHEGVPLWFDVIMLTSYAWNGLMVGFVSLWIVQGLLTRWFGFAAGWLGALTALGLAAFGVYLGRFERWNSWDVFTQPNLLFRQILNGILNPADNLNAIVITLIFCGMLVVMYLTLAAIGNGHDPNRR
jgi:uncharacterized membrane protein